MWQSTKLGCPSISLQGFPQTLLRLRLLFRVTSLTKPSIIIHFHQARTGSPFSRISVLYNTQDSWARRHDLREKMVVVVVVVSCQTVLFCPIFLSRCTFCPIFLLHCTFLPNFPVTLYFFCLNAMLCFFCPMFLSRCTLEAAQSCHFHPARCQGPARAKTASMSNTS